MTLRRIKATLKCRFPRLWVAYSARLGRTEIELLRLSEIVPPDRVSIDAGANISNYTRKLAQLTPAVHAFEPSREAFDILRRTVTSNVTVHKMALSDRVGTLSLFVPSVTSGRAETALASLDRPHHMYGVEIETIQTARLDDVVPQADVGFIKIDVEGHELNLLRGATAIIERCRPVLLVECEERHSPGGLAALLKFFEARNYRCRIMIGAAEWMEFADFDVTTHQNTAALRRHTKTRSDLHQQFHFLSARVICPASMERRWRLRHNTAKSLSLYNM
jgi:FkbM family methyltransferase